MFICSTLSVQKFLLAVHSFNHNIRSKIFVRHVSVWLHPCKNFLHPCIRAKIFFICPPIWLHPCKNFLHPLNHSLSNGMAIHFSTVCLPCVRSLRNVFMWEVTKRKKPLKRGSTVLNTNVHVRTPLSNRTTWYLVPGKPIIPLHHGFRT